MFNVKTIAVIGASLLSLSFSACSQSETSSTAQSSAPAAPPAQSSAQAQSSAALASGTFSGRSDHITTGAVRLVKTQTGYGLEFAEDFSLDGAPDPIVAIGNGETYSKANKLGALQKITGSQNYALPASFTPGQFSQVYVWCEKFDVPLGVATLTQ